MTQQLWGQPGQRNAPGYRRRPAAATWNRSPFPYGAPAPTRYGGSPGYRPPRRRQRSPLATLLLAVVVVVGLGLLIGTFTNAIQGSSSNPDVAYQNNDYQVPPPDLNPPPLPYATTASAATTILQANPFYDQTAPVPVRCNLPVINLQTASDSALHRHFSQLMACLVRVWEPPITAADWQIVRPSVTVYSRTIDTRCGNSGVNAFYCAADQQVYYSDLLPQAIPAVTRANRGGEIVLAHEFGHALQGRTGVLITANLVGQDASRASQMQISRRLEVQADCLSGMFLRSVSESLGITSGDRTAIENTYRAIGDDVLSGQPGREGDHGTAASRLYWGRQGLDNSTVSSCNTFIAPASRVR